MTFQRDYYCRAIVHLVERDIKGLSLNAKAPPSLSSFAIASEGRERGAIPFGQFG